MQRSVFIIDHRRSCTCRITRAVAAVVVDVGGEAHQGQTVMLTREEYTARLEQYLEDLKAEIVAVEAELADLRVQA